MGPYAVYIVTLQDPEPFAVVHHAPARVAFDALKDVFARWESAGYQPTSPRQGEWVAFYNGVEVERMRLGE